MIGVRASVIADLEAAQTGQSGDVGTTDRGRVARGVVAPDSPRCASRQPCHGPIDFSWDAGVRPSASWSVHMQASLSNRGRPGYGSRSPFRFGLVPTISTTGARSSRRCRTPGRGRGCGDVALSLVAKQPDLDAWRRTSCGMQLFLAIAVKSATSLLAVRSAGNGHLRWPATASARTHASANRPDRGRVGGAGQST
jgi:hypothetical protein